MKKTYCNPELSFVTLDPQDVLTSSWDDLNDVNGNDVYFLE